VQRIAVLPLTDLSGDPTQEYFADGMTEELITQLAQVNTWSVISRTSVMRYKGTKQPLRRIAGELGVSAVIEGTVLRSGGRVRITAQLIDAATDLHLWSGSFERELSDVLALQSGIAQAIASELNVALGPQEHVRLSRVRRVVPEAYEAYLQGSYFLNRDQFAKAASYFEQAAIRDSNFALAHALLYEAEAMTCFVRDQPLTDRALGALAKARQLDDTLAEVHTDTGDVRAYWDWDFNAGEAEFRRALELDPGSIDAVSHYAGYLHILGRWDEALRAWKRALQLDPVSPTMNLHLLRLFVNMHRYDLAMEQFQKVIDLDPNSAPAYSGIAPAYAALGREGEAVAAWLKADALSGKNPERVKALEAAVKAGGIRAYWSKRLEHLRQDAGRSPVPPLSFASVYVRLGRKDEAMKFLEAAYRQRAPRLVWIKASSVWDPLRSDPRFQDLLRRMRFPG
jgi:TolB-like protein/Tfp pilus assembly protein PilF